MSGQESGPNTPNEQPKKKGLSNRAYFKIIGYLLTAGWVGFGRGFKPPFV